MSVRLLMGCRSSSNSVVRLGPAQRSRTTSMVHLSPISCSAPAIGQPSILRRRKSSRPRIYSAAQKYAHLSISDNLVFLFRLLAGEDVIRGSPKYKQPEGWDFGLLPW